jgi:plasmid stability protein
VYLQLKGGEFTGDATRHFDRFLPRAPGLTSLSLANPRINPFHFYRLVATPDCVAADAFKSITSLSVASTSPIPDALAALFPSLVCFRAIAGGAVLLSQFGARSCRDDTSDDVHVGVHTLDLGAGTPSDAALAKLPLRFPQLREFVAPEMTMNRALLTAILGWRRTLTVLDLSEVRRGLDRDGVRRGLDRTHLVALLGGTRRDGAPVGALEYAPIRRLRLANWHRALEPELRQILAQRVAAISSAAAAASSGASGSDADGYVEIEWAPALAADESVLSPSLTPFVGFQWDW